MAVLRVKRVGKETPTFTGIFCNDRQRGQSILDHIFISVSLRASNYGQLSNGLLGHDTLGCVLDVSFCHQNKHGKAKLRARNKGEEELDDILKKSKVSEKISMELKKENWSDIRDIDRKSVV